MSKKRIKELETKILKARHDYYNENPTVSDSVYDAWVDELTTLSPASKAITAVGAPVVSSWPKIKHEVPMGSLNKVNTEEEFFAWFENDCKADPKTKLLGTEKLDGISLSLKYEDGVLIQGSTRGDGDVGEDITPNVRKMKGVRTKLKEKFTGHIRGEILLRKSDHKAHFPEKANPRNAASGIAKRYDGEGCEYLTVLCYTIEGANFKHENEAFGYIIKLGLKTPFYKVCTLASAIGLYEEYQEFRRDDLDYDIDGMVFRILDLATQEALGEKNNRPKGAIAYKFEAPSAETVLRKVTWQTGDTGRMTPVAEFDTVDLLGAKIKRASLYNYTYIKNLGLDVGASILVIRANDVIPKVQQVTKSTHTILPPPVKCEACGSKAVTMGEYTCCINYECPPQVLGRLSIWIKELGVLEWGDKVLQKLLDADLVKDVGDLYRLTAKDIASLDRMGMKSAENLIAELDKFREIPLENLIGGLGIDGVATSTTKQIMAAGYDSLDKMYTLGVHTVENIPGFGYTKAEKFCTGLKANKKRIDDILDAGLKIREKIKGSLTGRSFCFSGKSSLPKAKLHQLVEENGGDVKKSVGKGLDFLVLADAESTSNKAQAAKKVGTAILSEEEFMEMIGQPNK